MLGLLRPSVPNLADPEQRKQGRGVGTEGGVHKKRNNGARVGREGAELHGHAALRGRRPPRGEGARRLGAAAGAAQVH